MSRLVWGECPEGFLSECTRFGVPLNWERPLGRGIELFVARYPAAAPAGRGARKRQLWLLAGGPGGSGDSFADLLDTTFAPFRQTHDIYVIEHRGVGESTRLSCTRGEAPDGPGGADILPEELSDCISELEANWGADLQFFNITNAAKDLAYAIRATRQPGQEVFVYGVSYGTLWAQRYLQIAGGQADGVILDSVVPPTDFSLFQYDAQTDLVAMRLADMCARDAVCRSKLGEDPWKFIKDTVALVEQGHCAESGLTPEDIRGGGAVLVADLTLRRHLFPVMYRLRRCAPEDAEALGHYAGLLLQPEAPSRGSVPLLYNIALSELSTPLVDLETLEATCADAVLCPGTSVDLRTLYDVWPRYPTDRYFDRWFRTRTPVLALNGELDPQTPFEEASRIAAHLHGPAQNYVQLPYSPHITMVGSPVRDPEAPSCAVQIAATFLAHPRRRPDTRCVHDLLPVDFTISAEESAVFFGTGDAYENEAPPAAGQKARSGFRWIRGAHSRPL